MPCYRIGIGKSAVLESSVALVFRINRKKTGICKSFRPMTSNPSNLKTILSHTANRVLNSSSFGDSTSCGPIEMLPCRTQQGLLLNRVSGKQSKREQENREELFFSRYEVKRISISLRYNVIRIFYRRSS